MAKSNSFMKIPQEAIHTMLGKQVHVTWAPSGCTWVLKKVEGNRAILETPKSFRRLATTIDTLLYTKKNAPETNKPNSKE